MLIACPSCKTKFTFDESRIGDAGVKLRCNKCRTLFKLARKKPAPQQIAPESPKQVDSQRVKVVVANESMAFCEAVKKVLSKEPFTVFIHNDGREALNAIQQQIPEVVLLDVALPSMYGFEVCEAIRKDPKLAGVKVILIASIYDKTRYKRSPQSLYGADDYIEKHHIPDSLAAMIYRLVGTQEPLDTPSEAVAPTAVPVTPDVSTKEEKISSKEMAAQEATRQELKLDEERETTAAPLTASPEVPEAHQKARRLARIIVSDISLYNQAKVEEGVRNNTFFEILADDINEGRSLYNHRIPEEIRGGTSFLDDAFAELIAKKQREMNIQP
jgi:predicted Zn finger-like uncharacterized protein